jgi:TfoX/Sxy family transcriptional regulator of competence genes
MAYDDVLLERVRRLTDDVDFFERKMFGGVAFMFNGHMTCGLMGSDLMVRVGPEAYEGCLARPHAEEMKFTGKPMRGMITVKAAGIQSDQQLRAWIDQGLQFTQALKPK